MGEDPAPWFPQPQLDWQSPNLYYVGAPLYPGKQHGSASIMNPGTGTVFRNGSLLAHTLPELPPLRVGQSNDPHAWFYCLPRFRQAFTPGLNSILNDKRPAAPCDNRKEAITPKAEPGSAQKRFLVFDQSGDQTSLIFSSGIGTPAQRFASWIPKPTGSYNLNGEYPGTKENLNLHLGPISADEFGEKDGADLHSEMHEDTEELNALLDSDWDSDYTEDDEITSTGRSPSTMTAYGKQGLFQGSTEEVASSDGSTKKRKLFDGCYSDALSLVDTASSVKNISGLEYEDDAESRCTNGMNLASGELGSELGNKRMRKERIRDTVSILQNIIPGGKGKDAIVVIDEAINYLKSLKLKAKVLGFDAL